MPSRYAARSSWKPSRNWRKHPVRKALLLIGVGTVLSGCAVYPAPGYGYGAGHYGYGAAPSYAYAPSYGHHSEH